MMKNSYLVFIYIYIIEYNCFTATLTSYRRLVKIKYQSIMTNHEIKLSIQYKLHKKKTLSCH